MAVDVARESSDLFLPLKAVLGALTVLIRNYDVSPLQASVLLTADRFLQQTAANAEQIREIEERLQSLADVFASPVNDQDSGEKARRETLRKYVLFNEASVHYSNYINYPQKVGWGCRKAWTTI